MSKYGVSWTGQFKKDYKLAGKFNFVILLLHFCLKFRSVVHFFRVIHLHISAITLWVHQTIVRLLFEQIGCFIFCVGPAIKI